MSLNILIKFLLLSTISEVCFGGYAHNVNSYYGYGGKKHRFVPAPPGKTPPCAKHGSTYCEQVDDYPREIIAYLLRKYGSFYEPFFKSDNEEEFYLLSKTYGPAPYSHGQFYTKKKPTSFVFPTPNYNNVWKNLNSSFVGYSPSLNNNNQNMYSYYGDNNYKNRQQRHHNYFVQPKPTTYVEYPQFVAAAAVPPILQSVWWSHHDLVSKQPAFPHLQKHRNNVQRAKRQADLTELCPTGSRFIVPKAAMNNAGNWMFVVNMEDDARFVQQVRSTFCAAGDGAQCEGCSLPGSRCRQKYVQSRLIALDGSGESLQNEVFRLPHSCSCQVGF